MARSAPGARRSLDGRSADAQGGVTERAYTPEVDDRAQAFTASWAMDVNAQRQGLDEVEAASAVC